MNKERLMPQARKGNWKLSFALCIGVSMCFVVLLWLGFFEEPTLSSEIICGANLSGIGRAMLVYANDNNDILPNHEKWCDLLIEHVDTTPKQLICPHSVAVFGESSYAMNANIAGKKISELPSDTVMVFETDLGKEVNKRKSLVSSRKFFKFLNLPEKKGKQKIYGKRWNQVGGPDDITMKYHKGEGCNVLFTDAHVEFEKVIEELKWEVNEVAVELKIGNKAPKFTLIGQDGEKVSLSDFAGKKVLVYFYPKADTPGCTTQACSVRDSTEELKRAGVIPLGISPDEPDKQQKVIPTIRWRKNTAYGVKRVCTAKSTWG